MRLCAVWKGPAVMDIMGHGRWPSTRSHAHTSTCTGNCLNGSLRVGSTCSGTSLILSLRAAWERYLSAEFACDVGTEIERKKLVFNSAILLSDTPPHKDKLTMMPTETRSLVLLPLKSSSLHCSCHVLATQSLQIKMNPFCQALFPIKSKYKNVFNVLTFFSFFEKS